MPVERVADYDGLGLVKEILRLPLAAQQVCLKEAVTDVEQRRVHARPAAEVGDAADPAPAGPVEPAGAGGRGLWGTPIPTEAPPDRAARDHGMWTGPDSVEKTDGRRHQHGGSIRSRPWGPVPGLTEPTGWRRGLRQIGGKG